MPRYRVTHGGLKLSNGTVVSEGGVVELDEDTAERIAAPILVRIEDDPVSPAKHGSVSDDEHAE